MNITITAKSPKIEQPLHDYVTKNLNKTVTKYFEHPIEAHVVFDVESQAVQQVTLTVHVGSGLSFHVQGENKERQAAFDTALSHLDKRLRRRKQQQRSHYSPSTKIPKDHTE